MATVHIFLDDNDVRQAITQYLATKNIVAEPEHILFVDESGVETGELTAEVMNVKLPDGFKGL